MKFSISKPEIINVQLEDYPYNIYIGSGILTNLYEYLKKQYVFTKYIIVTDVNVYDLLGIDLKILLESHGLDVDIIQFQGGEKNKNLTTIESLSRELVKLGADRKSCLIALGGGVVGDVVGFLSSIYMRGIPFIQIPTTLLAQVDSSVGGKTGVDLPEGKNLIGTFYQPKAVFIDIGVLGTLPLAQIKNGIAEIIKYGVIRDNRLFQLLEEKWQQILQLEPEILSEIIKISCSIKADVVIRDEKEGDLRRILNFGHTLGHAIESLSNYNIQHGEAISVGMVLIGKISEKIGLTSNKSFTRLFNLIEKFGLPTKVPDYILTNDILDSIKSDKKAQGGKVFFVLMEDIGKVTISPNVDEGIIKDTINEFREIR